MKEIKEPLVPRHRFKVDPAILEQKQKEELRGPYTSYCMEMQTLFLTALGGRNVPISVADQKLKEAG